MDKKRGLDDLREDYMRIINKPPNPLIIIYFNEGPNLF